MIEFETSSIPNNKIEEIFAKLLRISELPDCLNCFLKHCCCLRSRLPQTIIDRPALLVFTGEATLLLRHHNSYRWNSLASQFWWIDQSHAICNFFLDPLEVLASLYSKPCPQPNWGSKFSLIAFNWVNSTFYSAIKCWKLWPFCLQKLHQNFLNK